MYRIKGMNSNNNYLTLLPSFLNKKLEKLGQMILIIWLVASIVKINKAQGKKDRQKLPILLINFVLQ